jgi:hypothetical protein
MNSSAWDKFRKQQAAEREQLRRLLTGMQPLLVKCRDAPLAESDSTRKIQTILC